MLRLWFNIPAQAAALKFDIVASFIEAFAEIADDDPISLKFLPAIAWIS
jgi:hypothetical protein